MNEPETQVGGQENAHEQPSTGWPGHAPGLFESSRDILRVVPPTQRPITPHSAARLNGKFLSVGGEKFYARGVTYGPFRPDRTGNVYLSPETVRGDLAQMSANGINAIRTFAPPPRWLLDIAQAEGLRVMVGFQAERDYAFLDDRKIVRDIRKQAQVTVRACAGHPAVLGYTLGNEIPAHVVRWHGARSVELYLRELYAVAKNEDPEGLFSYANYPTTEYLDLSFFDLLCFNVYLESQPKFEAYLARLQNLAGNRPLVLTEIGLDSRSNGTAAQAETLDRQVRASFAAGCAGAFIFAWTDEWFSRGRDVEDWDFGLTDRQRRPKPALETVRTAFAESPFAPNVGWPKISVVVCTYNGQRTLRDCLEGLEQLKYPNYEVIVVDDGSKDQTAEIVREHNVRLIRTENRGLSAARNTGWEAATGEIIAYIDDDTRPDPHWLNYLASTFLKSDFAGVGGPNIPFPDDGETANCIANSPGGPNHVLLSDTEAEHIPGCNMAFRKAWLQAIGGFDTQFRVAGDDVDVCWRIQDRGGRLGFSPAAVVWHHTRNSARAFWKQQVGYGKAEAMLEKKWPEKYNSFGHVAWAGRIYNNGLLRTLGWGRGRIYQGTWGTAGYTKVYPPTPGLLNVLPVMPEWFLIFLVFAGLSAMGCMWKPLMTAWPLALLAAGLPLVAVGCNVSRARFAAGSPTRLGRWRLQLLTAFLHVLQPLARLWGRLKYKLTPGRGRNGSGGTFPRSRTVSYWSETWQASTAWLQTVESALRANGESVRRGGDYDNWDLEVSGGIFGAVRILMLAEDHAGQKQFVRVRFWPKLSVPGLGLPLIFFLLSVAAGLERAFLAAIVLGFVGTFPGLISFRSSAGASAATARSLMQLGFRR